MTTDLWDAAIAITRRRPQMSGKGIREWTAFMHPPMPAENSNRGERPRVEQPRFEPEIIPPHQRGRWEEARARIYVARIGPVGATLLAVLMGLLTAFFLIILAGAFLLWIPVAALILVIALISAWWRGYFRRSR